MRLLMHILVVMMTLAMVGGAAVLFALHHYGKELPDYSQLEHYEPEIVTRLYAGDGKLLAEYATEKRVFVPIEAVPKRVIHAFLSAEDQNFYQHPGIDFMGIVRAAFTNLSNMGRGRSLVGGSTITQQVVKNFLLTNEKSIDRKIKEAILAFRISKAFSKDKILELYLNEIYLGQGSYGVVAAALNYFNKSVDELSVEEAAYLAALPKAPAHYDPRFNYKEALARRDWVIDRMKEDGYIDSDVAKKAKAEPITIRSRDAMQSVQADFFSEEVRRAISQRYGYDVLYKGGLVVRTTLDPHLQKIAEIALRNGLSAYDRRHGYRGPVTHFSRLQDWQRQLSELPVPKELPEGWELAVVTGVESEKAYIGRGNGKTSAIPFSEMSWARRSGEGSPASPRDVVSAGDVVVVESVSPEGNAFALRQIPEVSGGVVAMDPHTGRVLAMVGGISFRDTEFNRATQAQRQPGSAFKPFVYLSALENGYTPASVLLDAPVTLSQGRGMPTWTPQNYGGKFNGPSTLRFGVEKSRNAMTVRLALQLGIDRILDVGKRFHIYDNPPRNFSIVLGASETTLLKLTNAYAMLVNGGKRVEPYLIERIQDRHGKTIFKQDTRECEGCRIESAERLIDPKPPVLSDAREAVTDPQTAYQMVSILEGVVQRGTGAAAKKLGRPLAGKTGTTNDSFDTWFVGFSPDLVLGTYIGYDKPKSLGAKETGASVALPVFIEFMQEALADKPATPFRIPDGIRLMRVNAASGQIPAPGTPEKDIIFEAFKVNNTSPFASAHPVQDGEGIPALDEQELQQIPGVTPEEGVPTVGTGGLY